MVTGRSHKQVFRVMGRRDLRDLLEPKLEGVGTPRAK